MQDCFYRLFGGYANWDDRVWYNCPECKKDEKNKECKYYLDIYVVLFEVKDNSLIR